MITKPYLMELHLLMSQRRVNDFYTRAWVFIISYFLLAVSWEYK